MSSLCCGFSSSAASAAESRARDKLLVDRLVGEIEELKNKHVLLQQSYEAQALALVRLQEDADAVARDNAHLRRRHAKYSARVAELQKQLADTASDVQMYRRKYHGEVRQRHRGMRSVAVISAAAPVPTTSAAPAAAPSDATVE